jgi:Fic family protein
MRIPQPPPSRKSRNFAAIGPALGRPGALAAVERAQADYLNWDEFRRRPVPEGASHADLWQVVRLFRDQARIRIPLATPAGAPFGYAVPPALQATLHRVDRDAGARFAGDAGGAAHVEQVRDEVIVSSLMEEAIATSHIEGAVTTRAVAKEMLRSERRPKDRSERMIANSYQTIQLLRQRRLETLSVDLLCEVQARMTDGTLEDSKASGRIRRPNEPIRVAGPEGETLFEPPPAKLLPDRLARLVDFANAPVNDANFMHPLVKAAILHFWLAYEHPFVDGNGRTARALFYWFMLKNGYWLFEYLTVSRAIEKRRNAYYRSFLDTEQDGEDVTYSIIFQVDATRRAVDELRSYLERKQREQGDADRLLRALPDLNARQRSVIERGLREPYATLSFESHRGRYGVSLLTARNDLIGLTERGLLRETKDGRRRVFFPAEGLEARLRTTKGR